MAGDCKERSFYCGVVNQGKAFHGQHSYTERYPGPRYSTPARSEVEEYYQLVAYCIDEIQRFLKNG